MNEGGKFRTVPQDEESNTPEEARVSEGPSTFRRRLVQVTTLFSILLLVLTVGIVQKGKGGVEAGDDSTPESEDESAIQRSQWPPTIVTPDMFDSSHLDTDRPGMTLYNSRIVPGSYVSIIEMETESSFEFSGMDFSTDVDMKLEMEMSVEQIDEDDGGYSVDLLVTRLQMSGEQMGMSLEYDSDGDNNNPILEKGLEGVVGSETEISLDQDFKLVEVDQAECELHSGMQQHEDQTTGLTASDQFQSVSRMMQAIPDYPVKPGDEWRFVMDVGLVFDTQAQLLGYVDYEGCDCAVIAMVGEFHGSLEGAISVADDEVMNALGSTDVEEGKMSSVMFWDNERGISRWSSIDQDYVLSMPNPIDETQNMSIPTSQKIVTYTGSK